MITVLVTWGQGLILSSPPAALFICMGIHKVAKSDYITVFMYVCLSVCMEQLGFCWLEFCENLYYGVLLKSVIKIQFWLKLNKNK